MAMNSFSFYGWFQNFLASNYSWLGNIYNSWFGSTSLFQVANSSTNGSSSGTLSVRKFPGEFTVDEETPTVLDLAPLNLRYTGDRKDTLTITLSVNDGTLEAGSWRKVTVEGSGTDTITLTGTRSQLNQYFNRQDVTFTGAEDVSGVDAVTLTLTDVTGGASSVLGESDISITDSPDEILGTAADDVLTGTDGVDNVLGLAGNDTIEGGASADVLDGGTGTDWLQYANSTAGVSVDLTGAGTGVQTVSGGDAEGDVVTNFENVTGSEFDDVIIGDGNANYLVGGAGQDTIEGNGGDDIIRGGADADVLVGGAGTDVLQYAGSSAGVNVDLNTDGSGLHVVSGGDAEGDMASGFEDVFGSSFNDVIVGDAGANYLIGFGGDDDIDGGAGNDLIRGGAGADTLEGGAGTDLLTYLDATVGIAINLETGIGSAGDADGDVVSGFENVYGSNHNDAVTGDAAKNIIFGYSGDDELNGGGGNDTIRGGLGADTMDGGDGIDYVRYAGSSAGVTVDLNADEFGLQTAFGGEADGDILSGFENVHGTSYDDRMTGNEVANIFIGGAGADTFVFNAELGNGNVDRIVDFASGTDTIELDSAIFDELDPGMLDATSFTINDTGLATTADHRITYESDRGYLRYDADGSGDGGSVIFGRIQTGLIIDEGDFVIV